MGVIGVDTKDLEIHPLVRMLVARMESHPKEFYAHRRVENSHNKSMPIYTGMTSEFMGYVTRSKQFWNRAEKALFHKALRKVRMDEECDRLMEALLTDKQP